MLNPKKIYNTINILSEGPKNAGPTPLGVDTVGCCDCEMSALHSELVAIGYIAEFTVAFPS